VTGEGIEALLAAIDSRLAAADVTVDVVVQPQDGKLLAWLYENADVVSREADEAGAAHITVRVPAQNRHRLDRQLKERASPDAQ
jgi:GTP-binding protein HflX